MLSCIRNHEKNIIEQSKKLLYGDVLLNASNETYFVYELSGHVLSEDDINTFDNYRLFKDKFNFLDSLGVIIKFDRADNRGFNSNLMLIDTKMPEIIGLMLENFYRGNASKVTELTEICIEKKYLQYR